MPGSPTKICGKFFGYIRVLRVIGNMTYLKIYRLVAKIYRLVALANLPEVNLREHIPIVCH